MWGTLPPVWVSWDLPSPGLVPWTTAQASAFFMVFTSPLILLSLLLLKFFPLYFRTKVIRIWWWWLFSRWVVPDSLWPHGLQRTRLSCSSPTPRVCSDSCPLNQWCHPTLSSSVTLFPFALNLSQHQGLFQWVGSWHWVAKALELQLQCQSFQWIFGVDFL